MNRAYLPAIITYLAAFITCLICILNNWGVNESLIMILVVMVVFFIIGTIAKEIIDCTLSKKKTEEEKKEEITQEKEEVDVDVSVFKQELLGEKQDNNENGNATEEIS